jgi:hypothetical protein
MGRPAWFSPPPATAFQCPPHQDFGQPPPESLHVNWRNLSRVAQQSARVREFVPVSQVIAWRLFPLMGQWNLPV